MKFHSILIFSVLLFLFMACKNGKNTPNTVDDNGNTATVEGGCYHTAVDGWEEMVNIVYDGKTISGTGRRLNQKFNEMFNLVINGKIKSDGSFEVAINAQSTMEGKEGISESNFEVWRFDGRQLFVTNRRLSNFIGDMLFIKINCDGASKKDSSLYDSFFGFFEGYAVVAKNGQYGLVNDKWELVLPCTYKDLGIVTEGTIKYYDPEKGRHGVLDIEGNIIIEPKWDECTAFKEGVAAVLDRGKWGFVNREGEFVQEPKYASVNIYQPIPSVHPFTEGLANVAIADAQWGYINPKMEVVIPFKFLFAEPFKNGIARVTEEGQKWYFIDKNGNCVKDCE